MNLKDEIQNSKILESKALEACNDEPIETPGYIQSYGALIAFDFNSLIVSYASDYFKCSVKDMLGNSVRSFFETSAFHDISNIASHKSAFKQSELVKHLVLNTKEADIFLFRVPQYVVLEITPTHNNFNTYKINAELKWILNTSNYNCNGLLPRERQP